MNLGRAIQLGLVATQIITMPACSLSSPPSKKVVVGYLPIVAHLPAAVAEQKKFFEGVEIEPKVFGSSNDLLSALSRGDIQVATTVAIAPVLAQVQVESAASRPATVRLFSWSKTQLTNPFDSVFVRPDSELKSLLDLGGKRVGVFPGTTAKSMLSHLLRKTTAVDPSTVRWALLPPSVQLDQLRTGDIDALYTYETTRTGAELSGMREIHGSVVATLLDGAPFGCSAVNAKFADENPEVISRYVAGFDRGVLLVRTDPGFARQVLQTTLGVSAQVAQKCHLEPRLTSTEIRAEDSLRHAQDFVSVLRGAGELKGEVDVSALVWKKE